MEFDRTLEIDKIIEHCTLAQIEGLRVTRVSWPEYADVLLHGLGGIPLTVMRIEYPPCAWKKAPIMQAYRTNDPIEYCRARILSRKVALRTEKKLAEYKSRK